jgi:hypothetical protein
LRQPALRNVVVRFFMSREEYPKHEPMSRCAVTRDERTVNQEVLRTH